MPTYEYKCDNCAYYFEQFQSITEEALSTCPSCGGQIKRLVSGGAGVIYKGSGFYTTDYKKQNSAIRCGKEHTCCGRDKSCSNSSCEG